MDAHVALLVRRIGCHLALHGGRSTALGVLDRVLLAGLARNGVVACLAIVIAVHELDVGVHVNGDLHLIHREGFGATTTTRNCWAGRFGGGTLSAFLLNPVPGELGATDSQLLGAVVERATSRAGHLHASIAGDGTLWGIVEVQARLLLIGTLVAGTRAGWQTVAIAPGRLLNVLAPDTRICSGRQLTAAACCTAKRLKRIET